MNINNPQNENENSHNPWSDDLLWDEIEARLDRDRRRRFGLWLSTGLFALMMIASFVFYSNNFKLKRGTTDNAEAASYDLNQIPIKNGAKENSDVFNIQSQALLLQSSTGNNSQANIKHLSASKKNFDTEQVVIVNTKDVAVASERSALEHTVLNTDSKKLETEKLGIPSISLIPVLSKTFIKEYSDSIKNVPLIDYSTLWQSGHNDFFTFYVGAGLPSSSYNGSPQWVATMAEAERPLYTLTSSLNYAKSIYKNFYIESGLNYQKQINSFEFTDIDLQRITVQSDSAIVVGSEFFPGELTKTTTTTTAYSVFNRINSLNLTLAVGNRQKFDKHSLNINFGIGINLVSSVRGYILSMDNTVISLSSDLVTKPRFLSVDNAYVNLDYGLDVLKDIQVIIGGRYVLPLSDTYLLNGAAALHSGRFGHVNMYLGVRKAL